MMKACKCGSYAINHNCHGRDGSDDDLCDVCYWRKRAEQPAPMIRGDIRDGLVDDESARMVEQKAQQQEPLIPFRHGCKWCGKTDKCEHQKSAQQQETINGRTVKVDWKAQALELRELVRLGGIKIAELEAELTEQPAKQEPVAIALNTGTKQGVKWLKNVEHGESLYTTPQPAQQEPVALQWQQSPIRTAWGDDMVVASVAIDNDHTLSLYCERDQTPKVDAMFAQRTWVGLTTVIEMARSVGARPQQNKNCDVEYLMSADALERLVELVRADERNSWPAEMEAMERQVNILTDALAQASKDAARYQVLRTWDLGGYDHGLYSPEEIDKAVDGCIEDHT